MEESKDLKAGMRTSYLIGETTVRLKPLTLGKMKKSMEAFKKEDGDTFEMMLESLFHILDNGENPFATREWINDNVTMPLASTLITDMRVINGLDGFFPTRARPPETPPLVQRDLVESTPTPSV